MEIESQFRTHEIEQDDQSYSDLGSDCESTVTDSGFGFLFHDGIGVVRLNEEDVVYQGLRKRFFSLLGRELGSGVEVVAIHRKIWEAGDDDRGDGRLGKFLIRCDEVKRRDGGRVDVRRAWFGGSKGEIEKIVSHGFGDDEVDGNCSDGIRLSPEEFLLESLQSCLPDEDGLRHVLLCRFLTGKMKVVHPDSKEMVSSFEDFDTGVDDLQHPRRYIIGSTNMDIHILPEYVISFTTPSVLEGLRLNTAKAAFKKPTSPWMAFPLLIIELSKFLPYHYIKMICKDYKNYKEMKLSRAQFVRYIRNIAGDKLLAAVLRSRSRRNIKDERRFVHDDNCGAYIRRAARSNQNSTRFKDLDDLRKKNLAINLIRLLM